MQNILLTGGAGYIGSHTLLELAKSGKYKLTVFDNLKNGHAKAVEIIRRATKAEIDLVQGDLLNYDEIEAVTKSTQFDAVIHFAALIEAGLSVQFPVRFFENNVSGTVNLLKAMQSSGIKKLVFSSTAAVYGTPEVNPANEETPTKPENAYGSSKLAVEFLLKALGQPEVNPDHKINTIILRYFNAAGADPEGLIGQDYPKPTHLITLALEAALGKREKLTINGNDYHTADGTCQRDYIHVVDLARAHVAALQHLQDFTGYDVINIGRGNSASNLEVVKLVEKIHGPFNWEFGPRRPGDPEAYYANNTKAKKVLGWEPKYSLEEIILHAYNWIKSHPNGFKDIHFD